MQNKLRRQLGVWHLWRGIGIGITFKLATLHNSLATKKTRNKETKRK